MQSISPFLWFEREAEEAADFYVSVFPNSSIDAVSHYGEGAQLPAGTVLVVSFTLDGQRFQALNGGVDFPFSEAISFQIDVDTQEEVDHFWDALCSGGGEPSQCGWLKDRFGLSWQVVPRALPRLLGDPDPAAAQRAMTAMMGMSKLVIAELEAAARG